MVASGNISKNQSQCSVSYHSKDISELFSTVSISSYFILIEGAPGIGKTVLSKEIACQWAEKKLLKYKQLVFLLFLRDPKLKNIVTLEDLTQYVLNNRKKGSELSDHLFETDGKDLAIIFDGYDEMSEEDRNNSLVSKIISRKVLPDCDLVVTSRPTASLHLRDKVDCRVEVLGFTEEDRLDYIQQALEGSHKKILFLQSYLQSHATINALCYVPLNMTILLCLYEDFNNLQSNTLNVKSVKEIDLPKTQTEMYENFIMMTITRCINRSKNTVSDSYLQISELPDPYNKIFNELLQLAYYALKEDKIVFNSDEKLEFIQHFYKKFKSGNYEGLGLLKVIKHVNNVSFHFLHFSIQEYLAAYYIKSLSTNRQFQLLKDTFWDIHYFNTWIMYVGLTEGKQLAWKHFISGNWLMLSTRILKSSKISKKYLNDKIKSLHLFQCFAEIGDKELAKKIFKDKIIDLSNQTLLPRDISTLCFFILRSVNKQWIKLNLSNCNIGDIGSDILYKAFLDRRRDTICIDKVDFSYNLLQNQSILKLLEVVKLWRTSEVIINEGCDDYGNLFELCLNKFSLRTDDFSQIVIIGPFLFAHNINQQDLYNKLKNLPNLTGLYLKCLKNQKITSKFQEIKHKLNISKFHVIGKNVSVKFLGGIIQKMKEVDSIFMYDNTLSDDDVNYLSSLILSKTNSTNSGIWIVTGETKLLGNLSNFITLNKKFSMAEIFNAANSIRRLSSGVFTTNYANNNENQSIFEDLYNWLHKGVTKCEINFCMIANNLLIANGVNYSTLNEALSLNDQLISVYIKACKLKVTEIEATVKLISRQKSLKRLYVFNSLLVSYCFKRLCEGLLITTPWLKELLIHSVDSSCIPTSDLLGVQKNHTSILLIASDMLIGWNPTSRQLSLTLQLHLNITVWKLLCFHIDAQAFYQLAIMLNDLSELDISGCHLKRCELEELGQYTKQEKCFKNLTSLNVSGIKITNQAMIDMLNILSNPNKFSSSRNNSLVHASNLCDNRLDLVKLDISFIPVNSCTAREIAKILSQSTELEELNLRSCDLQTDTATVVFKGMKSILHLSKLNVSQNNITDEVASDLAEILSQNVTLKELDLSYNCLHATGVSKIFKKMKSILHLTKLNISHNSLTDEVADDLNKILSQNVELTEFDFSYNYLQAPGAITILKGMRSNLRLSKLNIGHNPITDKVTNDLAKILSRNVGLKELHVSYNYLQRAGAVTFFKALNSISYLSKFSINHIVITKEAANVLARILSQNVGLKELDLSFNSLEVTGATIVFKGMNMLGNLNKLNISNNSISGESAHEIAAVLAQKKSLEELDLSFNNLGASGAVRIFSSMKNYTRLIKLNVSAIGMTDFAAENVAIILNNNINLKELSLSDNKIQAEGATQIFRNAVNLRLSKFDISYNNITVQVADDMATFISQNTELEELDLSHNNLQTSGAVKICKTAISKLVKFNMSHNNITKEASDDIATFLSHNDKLQLLDLSFNNLGLISIFKHISPNNLSVLKISNCFIISKAAKELAAALLYASKLIEINLSHNDLSIAVIIKVFKGMKNVSNLVTIDISHNMITDGAADSIANVLFCNSKLRKLNVSHNKFSSSGIIKIFQGMRKASNLVALDISHNLITDEAADSIVNVLSNNGDLLILNVSSNYFRSAGCVKILSVVKSTIKLTKLDVSCNKVTINAIESSSYLSSKNSLHKADTMIFKMMGNISSLNTLNLANTMVSGVALNDLVAALSHNEGLKELDISNNKLQTKDAIKIFQGIKHIKTLTKLDIAHNRITDEATECLSAILPNCRELVELNLSHNNFYNIAALDCKMILNLTKIDVSNNNIDKQTVNELSIFLSYCTKLEELNLANNDLQTKGAIELFKRLMWTTLKAINISGNCITGKAAYHIASSLSKSKNLQEIDLSNNALNALAIRDILGAINILNLIKLNISNNDVHGIDVVQYVSARAINLVAFDCSYNEVDLLNISPCCTNLVLLNICNLRVTKNTESNSALAFLLSSYSKLQEIYISHIILVGTNTNCIFRKLDISYLIKLSISNSVIDEQAADDIGSFLSKNVKLKELIISCNKLNQSGTKILCQRIKNLSEIIKLNICGNNITHFAADDVAEVLLHNAKLEEIDVSGNLLANGVVSIFNGIKDVLTLRSINISHNCVTFEAADNISSVLSQSTNLRKLYLANNNFAAKGITTLCTGMSNILYLTHLDMSYNKITDEAAHSIASFLLHNPELKELDLSNNLIQTPGATMICKAISMLTNLDKFNIINNNITLEGAYNILDILFKIKTLEDLKFNASDGIKFFVTMENFTCKSLLNYRNAITTNLIVHKIADCLKDNIRLKRIDLSWNNLGTTVISNIFKKLAPSLLIRINISNNLISEQAADVIGCYLSQNIKLKELDISCNNFYESGIKTLCKRIKNLSELTKLKIGGNDFSHLAADDVAEVLLNNTKLEVIDISDNSLLTLGAVSIFNKINKLINLRNVNISRNWITCEAADNIVAVLSQNPQLNKLYLANNYLKADGIILLCKGMKMISCLTHLDMSSNEITDEAADDIAALLEHNLNLKNLDLSNNLIQATGATKIFIGIRALSRLNEMNICKNAITDGAADAVANFLSQSKLKEFDISYNYLQAEGAVKIFKAIMTSHLLKLNMSNNKITDDAAAVIMDVLSSSATKLKEVNLKDNYCVINSKRFSSNIRRNKQCPITLIC